MKKPPLIVVLILAYIIMLGNSVTQIFKHWSGTTADTELLNTVGMAWLVPLFCLTSIILEAITILSIFSPRLLGWWTGITASFLSATYNFSVIPLALKNIDLLRSQWIERSGKKDAPEEVLDLIFSPEMVGGILVLIGCIHLIIMIITITQKRHFNARKEGP